MLFLRQCSLQPIEKRYMPNHSMKYQSIDFELYHIYTFRNSDIFFNLSRWILREKWEDLSSIVSWTSDRVSIVLPVGENKIGSRANRVGQGKWEEKKSKLKKEEKLMEKKVKPKMEKKIEGISSK